MIDYAAARLNMVEGQLRTNKVTDEAVLNAFLAVPRERFVPDAFRGAAYVDCSVPLGGGRYVMEPLVLARLLQSAAIAPDDAVLEIGCGTGYGTALLARLAGTVVALESDKAVADQAQTFIAELGCANVTIVNAPLEDGHVGQAPYDVILINGAVDSVPEPIVRQLADGGRLVTVMKANRRAGQGVVMTRTNGSLSRLPVFDAAAPLLPELHHEPGFTF